MSVNGNKIGTSLMWNFGEKMVTQGIQLVISIVLARLLVPEDYGVLALVMVFVNVLTVFVETGLGSAIIQKKEIDRSIINKLFSINLSVSLLFYIGLFILAPWIAFVYSKYDANLLIAVIRTYTIILPIGAITSIQSAILYRSFQFRRLFFINTFTIIISGIVGIAMAFLGYGVWSLVAQQLVSKITLFIFLLFVLEWKPRIEKPTRDILNMVRFSSNILGNRLIIVVYNQIRSLFIGKIYSAADLAFYNKGETFPSMIATNTDYSLQKVMFSAYSKEQDDLLRIKQMMRRTIALSTYILTPIMFGLAVAAPNVVYVLLTDKWMPCVPYMRFFCLIYLLQPIKTSTAQALNGIGKSSITFRVGVVTKIIGIVFLFMALNISVQAIVIATLLTELLSLPFYFYVNVKYIDYRLTEQLKDLGVNMLPAIIVAAVAYFVTVVFSSITAIVQLFLQIILGIAFDILSSYALKNDSILYIVDKVSLLRRKKSE